ncbi:MAG: hypothetical protein ACI4TR_04490 [Bacteroidaceae bacterium]
MMLIVGLSFTGCSDDDGGSNSPLVGTWTKQIQWAGTNGKRDESYTFKADGTGTLKSWDWLDQRYYYYSFKWSANSTTISFQFSEKQEGTFYHNSGKMYYSLTSTCLTLYYEDGDRDGNYFKK